MLNTCRRGPASISRVFRATTSNARIASIRPSISPLSIQVPAFEARWLHVTSRLGNQGLAERRQQNDTRQQDLQELPVITKFQDLIDRDLVHPNVVDAITKGMGHETMTDVQSLTIHQGLQGTDIIAQARTGTGKTLGFLIPIIQRILQQDPDLAVRKRYSKARASDIRAIIISPTRELAEQIATEAAKLTNNTDLIVQVAVGGNSKRAMLMKTRREGCHILVGTPGRLRDVLGDEFSGVSAPKLTALVLDEADRLLDQGFSVEIDQIKEFLPRREEQDRQTLLYSATMPKEVMHLVRNMLKPKFHFVQTVKEGELATHDRVPQKIVPTLGLENYLPSLLEICKREIDKANRGEGPPFKAIVYFESTSNVKLAYQVFDNMIEGGGRFGKSALYPAFLGEIHGQRTQEQRTFVTEKFRRSNSGILFSTDVTARGMDFPNVTHVFQVGLPSNREQYIHRIGRTGRAGKEGIGFLIISEDQIPDARKMFRGLPITPEKTVETASVDMTEDAQLPANAASILSKVVEAMKMVDRRSKEEAYMGMISQVQKGVDVAAINRWSRFGMGLEEPPAIRSGLAQRLGLTARSGVKIENFSDRSFGRDRDSRGFGGRGFGGDSRGGRGFGNGAFGNNRGGRGGSGGYGYGGERRSDGFNSGRDRGGFGGRDRRGRLQQDEASF